MSVNHQLYTPMEVATALGVSQSSIRRWCDSGKLKSIRTAGGHRKLSIDAIMQFVRDTGQQISQAGLLGVSQLRRQTSFAEIVPEFVAGLQNDDQAFCCSVLRGAYLEGRPLSEIFDSLIGPAMTEVGNLWEHSVIGVDQERRCCRIVMQGLTEIENYLPEPKKDAPLALGAAPQADFAQIGTKMAEMVLRSSSWRTLQIGAGIPLEYVAAACQRVQPNLLWLSVIHLDSQDRFTAEYQRHIERLVSDGLPVALGGRAINPTLRSQIAHTFYGQTMQQLHIYCQGVPARSANRSDV